MDFRCSEEEEQFRNKARQFIKENITQKALEETVDGIVRGPNAREFVSRMADEGLLGLSWPKEYGGKEMPAIYDFHLNDELAYAGAPQTGKGVGIIGRTLMKRGTEWQKQEFLPMILKEEVEFAVGYTEPEAGSDLASMQLRATEDGDDYVLNGQKMFSSSAHVAEWEWMMARTDPNLPKHKGLSLFLVDMNIPGITVRSLVTLGDELTNEVYFDNVRVPKKYLMGKPNEGWRYMMEALSFERATLFPAGLVQQQFDNLLEWVKKAETNGRKLSKDPMVRHKIARLATEMEVFRLLELRVVNANIKGEVGDIEAAMHKLYGSHLEQRIAEAALNIMGAYGVLKRGSKHVKADGYFEHRYRFGVIRTVGGGSSEIQKNIISRRYLGLPN